MIQHIFTPIQNPSLRLNKHKAGSQLCAENAIEIQIKKKKKKRRGGKKGEKRRKKLNDNQHVSVVTFHSTITDNSITLAGLNLQTNMYCVDSKEARNLRNHKHMSDSLHSSAQSHMNLSQKLASVSCDGEQTRETAL